MTILLYLGLRRGRLIPVAELEPTKLEGALYYYIICIYTVQIPLFLLSKFLYIFVTDLQ